jgi:hypothetical protein
MVASVSIHFWLDRGGARVAPIRPGEGAQNQQVVLRYPFDVGLFERNVTNGDVV